MSETDERVVQMRVSWYAHLLEVVRNQQRNAPEHPEDGKVDAATDSALKPAGG